MKTPTDIGERIRVARLKRDMTREAVATALGESPATVRGWEKGFTHPRPEKVSKIERWIRNGGGK